MDHPGRHHFQRSDEALLSLAQRASRGDETAFAEFRRYLLSFLTRRVRRLYHRAPDYLICDVCEDTIQDFAIAPDQFEPTHGASLRRFVLLAATRNLADALKAHGRRRDRERAFSEEQRRTSSSSVEGNQKDVAREILSVVDNGPQQDTLAQWLAGERRTDRLAASLGIASLALEEQRLELKRFKDRVRKRVFRLLVEARQGSR